MKRLWRKFVNWLKRRLRKWFFPEKTEPIWLEDLTNQIYAVDKHIQEISEYKSKVISGIYRRAKYYQNCLSYLVFTYFDGEVEIDREEFDGHVWHCEPIEREDDFITTLIVKRERIPSED